MAILTNFFKRHFDDRMLLNGKMKENTRKMNKYTKHKKNYKIIQNFYHERKNTT